jgi:hypothetical protein
MMMMMMTKQHPSKRRIRVKSFAKNICPHFALSREVPTAAVLLEMAAQPAPNAPNKDI